MKTLVKILSHFFIKDRERVKTPIWGLIPVSEMNPEQVIRFVDEFSDSMVALSMEGFEIVYDMISKDPVVKIRGDVDGICAKETRAF